jgi:molybdate transport system substrate-binding protein
MGAWKRVSPRALRLADAAQARVLVERGEATFGILYESDVAFNPRLEAAGVFPPDSHAKIRYEIALTRAAATNPAARSLLEWLSGAAARGVFARFGFGVK